MDAALLDFEPPDVPFAEPGLQLLFIEGQHIEHFECRESRGDKGGVASEIGDLRVNRLQAFALGKCANEVRRENGGIRLEHKTLDLLCDRRGYASLTAHTMRRLACFANDRRRAVARPLTQRTEPCHALTPLALE